MGILKVTKVVVSLNSKLIWIVWAWNGPFPVERLKFNTRPTDEELYATFGFDIEIERRSRADGDS